MGILEMASEYQDRWLLAGLGKASLSYISSRGTVAKLLAGILGYFAARTAHRQLFAVRTAAQITQDNKPQDILNQRTENGMPIGCGKYGRAMC